MGVPGGDKGGACKPATDGQIGRWEEKNAGPADKNEAVALEPVIEDVKPSPLWRASYSDRHEKSFMKLYVPSLVGARDSVGTDPEIHPHMSKYAHDYSPAFHSRR